MDQIYLPKITKINASIIALSGGLFILEAILTKFSGVSLGSLLGLSAQHFFDGHFYSVLTYPLVSRSIMEVILNCLMLWLMGSEFESNWGTERYLKFILSSVIGGGVLFLLISFIFFKGGLIYSYPLFGLSGLVSSLCIAYAVIYPERLFAFMMVIPIKAKYFCFILVLISLSQAFSGPMGVGAWGQLGAIASAYLFMVVVSHRNFKGLSQKIAQFSETHPRRKSRAKLSIVKDDKDEPPKYWH